MDLRKEKWLHGKRFVYSVTYDEGFVDLLEHTLPVHDRFGFPGQLGMVAGQVGQPRNVEASSWNGKLHMNAAQIGEFLSRGWGVSSHSMTHGVSRSMYADPYTEVVGSRKVLEDLLDIPITSFIVPYDNDNHPPVIEIARANGYLSIFTLTDDVNDHDSDYFALYRSPLVGIGFYPFYSRLDPYMRLHQAREMGGWVVDYTHLTNPKVVAPTKEISQDDLIQRFEKVVEVGGRDVWAANCDEVVDYMLLHRGTELVPVGSQSWRLSVDVSPRVTRRTLTLSTELTGCVQVDPPRALTYREARRGRSVFSLDVEDGLRITIGSGPN